MSRTTKARKSKPRPGAAKLGVDLDRRIGEESSKLADVLIKQFIEGCPTAMNIIARWAQDAEFGEKCEKVHGRTLVQLLQEIDAGNAQNHSAEGDPTSAVEGPDSTPDPGLTATCSTEPIKVAA